MKNAFTMAEVLITLTIIGIIAVLTIPNLLNKYQTAEAVSRGTKAYNTIADAVKRAETEHGSIASWDIGTQDSQDGARKLAEILLPHLKTKEICGFKSGCFSSKGYKTLHNNEFFANPYSHSLYYRATLEDGMALAIWGGGKGCQTNMQIYKICGDINIDTNGTKGPNKAGIDYLLFEITENGVFPAGIRGYKNPYGFVCNYKTDSRSNGLACTAWLIYKKNTDYLKRNINWD